MILIFFFILITCLIDIVLILYWYCIDIVLILYWYCIDIVLILYWYCKRNPYNRVPLSGYNPNFFICFLQQFAWTVCILAWREVTCTCIWGKSILTINVYSHLEAGFFLFFSQSLSQFISFLMLLLSPCWPIICFTARGRYLSTHNRLGSPAQKQNYLYFQNLVWI